MENSESNLLDLSMLTVDGLYEIAQSNANYGKLHGIGFVLSISPTATVDEVGIQINKGEFGATSFGNPRYWEQLKKEFRLLVCTKDVKYQSLRKELSKTNDKAQLTIVSAISAAVGSAIGIYAAALVPVCAVCLIAVLKLGKEAFCQAKDLDVTMTKE